VKNPRSRSAWLSWRPSERARTGARKLESEVGSDTKLAELNTELTRLSTLVEGMEAELATAESDEDAARFHEAKMRALAASAKLVTRRSKPSLLR